METILIVLAIVGVFWVLIEGLSKAKNEKEALSFILIFTFISNLTKRK